MPHYQTVPYLETANERGLLPLVSLPPAKSSTSSEQITNITGIHQKSKPWQVIIALTIFPRGG